MFANDKSTLWQQQQQNTEAQENTKWANPKLPRTSVTPIREGENIPDKSVNTVDLKWITYYSEKWFITHAMNLQHLSSILVFTLANRELILNVLYAAV